MARLFAVRLCLIRSFTENNMLRQFSRFQPHVCIVISLTSLGALPFVELPTQPRSGRSTEGHRGTEGGYDRAAMHCVGSIAGPESCAHTRVFVRFVSLWSRASPIDGYCVCRNRKRTLENSASGEVELSSADIAAIKHALATNPVKGTRY